MMLSIADGMGRSQALAGLFEQLMGVYSVSDCETQLADAIESFLRGLGYGGAGRSLTFRRLGDTVVASTNFGLPQRVILAGHIDTVPVIENFPPAWLEPSDQRVREDVAAESAGQRVMWGRGATDMKASDAVFLYIAYIASLAARTSEASVRRPRYDLTFVFYDHEEVAAPKNGLRKVVQAHPDWVQGDFAIIGEPTSCGIEGGCNGTMRFDVVTHGVAAHSARAWMGHNAIHDAAEVLARLERFVPTDVTVDGLVYREGLNATMISGGTGTNVIPDECRVHVNYRFAPDKTIGQAKVLMFGGHADDASTMPCLGRGEMVAAGGLFQGFGVEMKDESPAARPGMDSPLAASLARLVSEQTGLKPEAKLGWTDVARFSQLGVPAVNFGAGSPLLAHKADEQLPVSQLDVMASILLNWLCDVEVGSQAHEELRNNGN